VHVSALLRELGAANRRARSPTAPGREANPRGRRRRLTSRHCSRASSDASTNSPGSPLPGAVHGSRCSSTSTTSTEPLEQLRDQTTVLRGPANMPWGERVVYLADADDNPVALAAPSAPAG
jgi:hypothetical protein